MGVWKIITVLISVLALSLAADLTFGLGCTGFLYDKFVPNVVKYPCYSPDKAEAEEVITGTIYLKEKKGYAQSVIGKRRAKDLDLREIKMTSQDDPKQYSAEAIYHDKKTGEFVASGTLLADCTMRWRSAEGIGPTD